MFNKGLAPSFNAAGVGGTNLSFGRRLYLLLNEKMKPSALEAEDILA